jgi:hypothetical protein
MHQRQQERQRLAGARLSARDQIDARKDARIHGTLNRCRRDKPPVGEGSFQMRIKSKRREWGRCRVASGSLEL